MARVFIFGQINAPIRETGGIIKCMAKAYLNGQMVANILANIVKTAKKVMENLAGLMAESTVEAGSTVNNMVMEFI